MTTASRTLSPRPDSVRAARRFVMRVLSTSPGRRQCDDATLLVGELVSNAVLHARTPIELKVRVNEEHVRVEVTDRSSALPQLMSGVGESMAGRGIYLVDSIAKRWGVDRIGRGKTVWFELSSR